MLSVFSRWLRRLYDFVLSLAGHKHAQAGLFGVAFAESSFFPIPPDILLIPMVIAKRHRWLYLAALCTIASVLGAFLGYFIGAVLFEFIGKPILAFYGMEEKFSQISAWYNQWGGWGVLFAAITPFPYKVITIFSGATGLNLFIFALVSVIGRGLRFFLVSFLLYHFGEPVRQFIEKRLGLMFTIAMVLLIGGFAAIKFVF